MTPQDIADCCRLLALFVTIATKVEWAARSGPCEDTVCIVCGGQPGAPMYRSPELLHLNHHRVGHAFDCSLANALTMAGVPEAERPA